VSDDDTGAFGAHLPPRTEGDKQNHGTPEINKPTARKQSKSVAPDTSESTEPESGEPRPNYRVVFGWFFLFAAAIFTFLIGAMIVLQKLGLLETEGILLQHFSAIMGLPIAAIASLFIVLVCEVGGREKMKIQALGFKFEGASSQVILWVVCFLAIAVAIRVLWW
jgi:hypothetical protein